MKKILLSAFALSTMMTFAQQYGGMWIPTEVNEKEMMIEAILLIQQGANPNTLVSKLEGFLQDGQNDFTEEV